MPEIFCFLKPHPAGRHNSQADSSERDDGGEARSSPSRPRTRRHTAPTPSPFPFLPRRRPSRAPFADLVPASPPPPVALAKMEQLIQRLEAVCVRLGQRGSLSLHCRGRHCRCPSSPRGAAAAGGARPPSTPSGSWSTKVNKLVSVAAAIGDADLQKTTGFLKTAFDEEAKVSSRSCRPPPSPSLTSQCARVCVCVCVSAQKVIACVASCKKPDMQTLQSLLKPTADQIGACYDFAGDRKNKAFQHTKVMSECMQGLTWVAYTQGSGMSMPMKTVQESWNSAEFFANKLLMTHKGDKNQTDWVNTLKELMKDLAAYVKAHHPTGPSWNPAGSDAKSFAGGGLLLLLRWPASRASTAASRVADRVQARRKARRRHRRTLL